MTNLLKSKRDVGSILILRKDNGGEFWNIVIGAVVGAAINAVSEVVTSVVNNEPINWGDVAIEAASGALSGALNASGVGFIVGVVAEGTIAAGTSLAHSVHHQDSIDDALDKSAKALKQSIFSVGNFVRAGKKVGSFFTGGKFQSLGKVGKAIQKLSGGYQGNYIGSTLAYDVTAYAGGKTLENAINIERSYNASKKNNHIAGGGGGGGIAVGMYY